MQLLIFHWPVTTRWVGLLLVGVVILLTVRAVYRTIRRAAARRRGRHHRHHRRQRPQVYRCPVAQPVGRVYRSGSTRPVATIYRRSEAHVPDRRLSR